MAVKTTIAISKILRDKLSFLRKKLGVGTYESLIWFLINQLPSEVRRSDNENEDQPKNTL